MSRYRMEIRPSVKKTLRKIRGAKFQRGMDDTFNKLAENPRRMGAEKMAGLENRHRFHVKIAGSSTKFTPLSCWS